MASSVWSQEGPGQVSAPPLTSCVTLDKSPLLSEPQFLLCERSPPQRGLAQPSSICPFIAPIALVPRCRYLVCSFFGVCLPLSECKFHESRDFCLFCSLLYLQDLASSGTQQELNKYLLNEWMDD